MHVGLIDVDSKIPNLALMRASAYHKSIGDSVKMFSPMFDHPDLVYASKIFDFTPDYEYFPDCETLKGGTGYNPKAKMPFPDYDRIMPDYSLYGCEYAIGRFTRGCPNNCPWCLVPEMDGHDVRHVANLSDFWNGQDSVRLLDDNIMADEDEFVRDCEQLSKAGVKAEFDALDIRLVNDVTARALASVKTSKCLHFSWDGHSQDDSVQRGLEILNRNGIKPYRTMFYVLVGFNTTPDYDMRRIEMLRKLGSNPFVMPYDKANRYQKDLARWTNNKAIFKSVAWNDYIPHKKAVQTEMQMEARNDR